MGLTAADYLNELISLLPPGIAWTADEGDLQTLLQSFADTLADVDSSATGLLDEADWRTTFYLLPDWERVAGLPDPILNGAYQSVPERRAWLMMRMTMLGGQSRQFFINLAAMLGYVITITESHASGCGGLMCGRDQLGGAALNVTWTVHMPPAPVYLFQCGLSGCGDPLGYAHTGVLEALIQRLKPAHTYVNFVYGS